jgi:hypothetical protein
LYDTGSNETNILAIPIFDELNNIFGVVQVTNKKKDSENPREFVEMEINNLKTLIEHGKASQLYTLHHFIYICSLF